MRDGIAFKEVPYGYVLGGIFWGVSVVCLVFWLDFVWFWFITAIIIAIVNSLFKCISK